MKQEQASIYIRGEQERREQVIPGELRVMEYVSITTILMRPATSHEYISINVQAFHVIIHYTSRHHPLHVISSSTKLSIYVFKRFSVNNSMYLWVAHHKILAVEIHVGSII
jgi:hypothetical protein